MDFTDEKKRRTAFHEAGHAWMMWKEGIGVGSVSIEPHALIPGDNRGETIPELTVEEGSKTLVDKFARAALAGSAAEHFLLGSWDEDGLQASAHDTKKARNLIAMSVTDLEPDTLDHYVQVLSTTVMEEVARPRVWNAITGLAYELLESGTLTGEQVMEILSEG